MKERPNLFLAHAANAARAVHARRVQESLLLVPVLLVLALLGAGAAGAAKGACYCSYTLGPSRGKVSLAVRKASRCKINFSLLQNYFSQMQN